MSSLEGQELIYGALLANIFVPGAGNVDKTFDTTSKTTNKVTKMLIKGDFVEVTIRGIQQGHHVTTLIPITSFINLVAK